MIQKLKEHSWLIAICFLLVVVFKQCGVSSTLKRTNKRLEYLTEEVIKLKDTVATREDLEIEGLKSEKRMIQSTDRRKWDLERENEIDKILNQKSKR